jgi:hypothetical protein
VEARCSGGTKKAQQWAEDSETGTKKIGRNCKKKKKKKKKKNPKNTETDKKVIQQNIKTNTRIDEVGEEENGQGAPGLGTSSKLLEPGAKGEAIPPPLRLVADPIIHFIGDVNKIIKYNDKICFFLFIYYIFIII